MGKSRRLSKGDEEGERRLAVADVSTSSFTTDFCINLIPLLVGVAEVNDVGQVQGHNAGSMEGEGTGMDESGLLEKEEKDGADCGSILEGISPSASSANILHRNFSRHALVDAEVLKRIITKKRTTSVGGQIPSNCYERLWSSCNHFPYMTVFLISLLSLLVCPVTGEEFIVNDQTSLFNLMCVGDSVKVPSSPLSIGDHITLNAGTYVHDSTDENSYGCRYSHTVYQTTGISFTVSCSGSGGTCVLDGNTEKRIFAFYDVEKDGELLIKNLTWRNGRIDKGGCLYVEGGRVNIQHSTFTNCEATHGSIGGGGIFAWGSIDYLHLHSVRFLANKSPVYGADLYVYQGSIQLYGCEFSQPASAGSSNVHNKGASISFSSNCPKGQLGVLSEDYNPVPASFLSGVDATGELVSYSTEGIFCSLCPHGTFGAEDYATSCSPCGQGMYGETMGAISNSSCSMCPPGTYQEDEIANSINDCISCSEGKFSQLSAATSRFQCRNCEPGTYSSSVGATSCLICTQGKYSFEMASACSNCPAGRASSIEGSNSCTDCVAGKYTSAPAQTTCNDCDLGTYTNNNASVTCAACPGGKSGNDNRQGCDLCPNGKFSNPASATCSDCNSTAGYVSIAGSNGASICEFCGAGFYADISTHECKECEVGKFSIGGKNKCEVCPAGTNTNNQVAATACEPCSPGSVTVDNICVQCEKGKYAAFGALTCSECSGEGEYAAEKGQAACFNAPAGFKPVSETDRTGIVACPPGKYSIGGKTSCTSCKRGEFSEEGAVGCSTCTSCAAGRYTINTCSPTSDTVCGDCLAGTASSGGTSTECTACVGNGKYSDTDLASFCKTAKAGFKPTEDRKGEEQCLEGTFSTGGAEECTACGTGETSGKGAAGCSRCATCAAGRYMISSCSPTKETECGDCLAGTASMGG
eukprot:CAMPEP_0118644850 /NCGR_PEP_ID=MMETSP0785-20121206/7171_1 /TAXON_ID=91992 /ORGANISM="Bolidomonas pacifica, Strain CCMP 1866" /LENGTH=923 /DNA_ID=CAMNT_0006536661 /DNA_START=204 /DNA_END=2971 /DNA_ORIENTATION=-